MNNRDGLKEQFIKILISNGKDQWIKFEKLDWILEQISHVNNEINGKSKQVRYLLQLMLVFTALYAKAPGAYSKF